MSEVKINYDKLRPVLDAVNSEVIKLAPDTTAKHTLIMVEVVTALMDLMKKASNTFRNLEPAIKNMGSYFEDLKIVTPDEYDLFIVLKLPVQPELDCSGLPEGYTRVRTPTDALASLPEAHDWRDAEGNFQHAQVRRWLQSVIDTALNDLPKEGSSYKLRGYTVASGSTGPAYTLKLSGGQITGIIEVDLIPTMIFPLDKLPEDFSSERYESIRKRVTLEAKYWLAVPKGPPFRTCGASLKKIGWNIDFQPQEKQLLNNAYNLKAAIKLVKKLRDKQNMSVSSYSIKSIFFMELEKRDFDETFWNVNSLPYLFLAMIKVFYECLEKRFVPDLWFPSRNVLTRRNINEDTFTNWTNMLKRLLQTAATDPEKILDYMLTEGEKKRVSLKLKSKPKFNFYYVNKMKNDNNYFKNADPTLNAILKHPVLRSAYYLPENFNLAQTIAAKMLKMMCEKNELLTLLEPKLIKDRVEKWTTKIDSIYDVKFYLKLPNGHVLKAMEISGEVAVLLPTPNKSVMPWADEEGQISASGLILWVQNLTQQILQHDGENYSFEGKHKVTKTPNDGNFVVTASHGTNMADIKFKLTPSFVFDAKDWPGNHWKMDDLLAKITFSDTTFLTIPKQGLEYFCMDFGGLEMELLSREPKVQLVIRLVERFCYKQEMKVDARCIATLILWEMERKSFKNTFWEKNCLTLLIVHVLKALKRSFKDKLVRNFWFPKENVLPKVAEIKDLNNILTKIEEEIDFNIFGRYFVTEERILTLAIKVLSLNDCVDSTNKKKVEGKRRQRRRRSAPKTR